MHVRGINPAAPRALWQIALSETPIEAEELVRAIAAQIDSGDLDTRTRMLIRDAVVALRSVRGTEWVHDKLPQSNPLKQILEEPLEVGFHFLKQRLMSHMNPDTALKLLRDLGSSMHTPTRIVIGGSISLLLANLLNRVTDDIDVVDEIPQPIRSEHTLLNDLQDRYKLRLTHFQSHYLPLGWESRVKSLGKFGVLDVYRVDEYDIAIGKLFSKRAKDLDDFRMLTESLDKASLVGRFRSAASKLLAEPDLRQNAERNWYIVFGESLPVGN